MDYQGPGRTPLTRTPVRGFPPARGQGQPAQDEVDPWHAPQPPLAGEGGSHPPGDGYAAGSGNPDGPGGGYAADHDLYAPGGGYAADHDLYAPGGGYAADDGTGFAAQGGAYFAPGDDAPQPEDPAPAASPRTRRDRRRGRRLRFRATLLAVGVLVLGGGALAGYKYLYEPRVNAPVPSTFRLPTTSQGSPDFDQALGKWQHIGTRAEDPDPLTIDGLYPPRFEFDGSSYTRTAASITGNCSLAVYGARLQAALQSGHCSQVARASYVSGTIMGTIGVVNLISAAAAEKAGQVTGPQEIIAPLSSAQGVTSKLGSGTGVVQAEFKGHYLILIWAEFTDLESPSTAAARQLLEQFATNLLTGSANINLSTRMLSGKG